MSRMWTAEQVALLIELYSDTQTEELVRLIGKSIRQIYMQANLFRLRKSKEYLAAHLGKNAAEFGKMTRFKPGHKTWNTGLKGVNGKSNTTFKAGNVPRNTQPVGTTRMTKDGWPEVKIADPNKWKGVHIVVWEKYHGPVPNGCIVRHNGGDVINPRIEDLELLTRAENMALNTVHRYPPELKHAIRLVKKLQRKIDERENN